MGPVTVAAGGVVNPGNSPGVLPIDGDFILDGGALEIEIEGSLAEEFDQLVISGTATLLSGDVYFQFEGTEDPEPGDYYRFLVASNGVNAAGDVHYQASGLSEALDFKLEISEFAIDVFLITAALQAGGFALGPAPAVDSRNDNFSTVPNPPSAVLLLLGLLGFIASHHKRPR